MSDPQSVQGDAALPVPAVLLHPQRRRSRRRPGRLAVVLLIVFGLGGVAGGGTGLYLELARGATRTEVSAALREDIASRWRRLPSGQIFPATVSYYLTTTGFKAKVRRVGIAPAASCDSALDPAAARILRREGCIAVLRATYVDSSGTVASTVGVAVMRSTGAAAKAAGDFAPQSLHTGVRPVAFPGTVTRLFGNAQRVWFDATLLGPYILFSTVGYTSGPYGHRTASPAEFSYFGIGFTDRERTILVNAANPCQREDIRC